MMTVKQLRESLANIPDDVVLILQKDDEGNGYRYMRGIDYAVPPNPDANFYSGEYGGECIRYSDILWEEENGFEFDRNTYPILCAIAY